MIELASALEKIIASCLISCIILNLKILTFIFLICQLIFSVKVEKITITVHLSLVFMFFSLFYCMHTILLFSYLIKFNKLGKDKKMQKEMLILLEAARPIKRNEWKKNNFSVMFHLIKKINKYADKME